MTTDDFTTAAEEAAADCEAAAVGSYDFAAGVYSGHQSGTAWARTYLAEQEPADAEVLAALNAAHPTYAKNNLRLWGVLAVEQMRAALSAARAVRTAR